MAASATGRFGYRLNATHEEGKTYNDGGLRRDALSLALDARLTQAGRLARLRNQRAA